MKTHCLKTWPDIFKAMKDKSKSFDVRVNDRDFQIGDQIILNEYDPKTEEYSGDHIHALITFILKDPNPFMELGANVILSLKYDF